MEKNELVYRSRKKILFDNFLGGLVWSLGMWLGTTVIVGVSIYLFSKIDIVPIIGDFVADISKYVVKDRSFFPF